MPTLTTEVLSNCYLLLLRTAVIGRTRLDFLTSCHNTGLGVLWFENCKLDWVPQERGFLKQRYRRLFDMLQRFFAMVETWTVEPRNSDVSPLATNEMQRNTLFSWNHPFINFILHPPKQPIQ